MNDELKQAGPAPRPLHPRTRQGGKALRISVDDGLHADLEAQMAVLVQGRLADGRGFTDAPMYEHNESGLVDKSVVNEEGELDFERYVRLIGAKHPDKRKPEETA